jgi:hypothetical protein
MLTAATLGMVIYGGSAAASGVLDRFSAAPLELWADGLMIVMGIVLMLAAAFVRVLMPGGLALAIGALLSLQALAIHNAAHLYGAVAVWPQVARGAFAAILVALAYVGSRRSPTVL